jgi:hypothetical protein
MKPKKLLPLIIILVVLAGLVFLRQQKSNTPSIIEQVNLQSLIPDALNTDDIGRIELYAGGTPDDKVVLSRDGDAWQVTTHFDAPVKADAIDGFLGKLVKMKGEFRASAASDAEQATYQLKDDEAFHVRVYKKGSDEVAVDLLLGKAPDSKSVFMRKAGENDIFVEGTNLRRDAGVFADDATSAPAASHWLNKDVLKLEEDAITKVALTMPDKALTFEKRVIEKESTEAPAENTEDGTTVLADDPAPVTPEPIEYEWVLASGGTGISHESSRLTGLLGSLKNFSASDIVDPAEKAAWGLETPAFTGTISINGQDDIVVEGGRPERTGDGYIRLASATQETIYKVSSFTFERLFPKGADLFKLPTLGLTSDDITHIEIDQPEGNIVLDKSSGDWTVVAPPANLDVQDTAIKTLATTLQNWTPSDYADSPEAAGEFTRALRVKAGARTRTISVGTDAAAVKGAYVKIDGEPTLLAMNDTDIAKLFLKARDVYALTLLNIDEETVSSIEANYGENAFTLKGDAGNWTLAKGEVTRPADAAKASDLLATLTELQAKNLRFDITDATWDSHLTLDLRLTDGTSYKFNIAPQENGVHLLTLSGQSNAFELEASDVSNIISQLNDISAPEPVESEEESTDAAPEVPTAEAAPIVIQQ